MKTDTGKRIIQFINKHEQARPADLVEYLNISPQAVFRQLKKLLTQGDVRKIGKPPTVFYTLQKVQLKTAVVKLPADIELLINNEYLQITPAGQLKEGVEAFMYWCEKTKQPVQKTAEEYVHTFKKYQAYKHAGLIDGMQKLTTTFNQVYLDHIYYFDFYSIERFGKTKLGQLLLYAKQTQNQQLIDRIIQTVKPKVQQLIHKKNIDTVGFIPPTIKREIQFMFVLAKGLRLSKKILSLTKVTSEIAVPQKSLVKIEDRVENAYKTIFVTERSVAHNILLIDDAVGSGATLNETAKKIRTAGLCTGEITGLALTGSYKGFDVISEV